MTKFKTIVGLCAVSAIAICAFAAQSASAARYYLCTKGAPAPRIFTDPHCKNAPGGEQTYGHFLINPNASTPLEWTNETTAGARSTLKLKSVQSGVTLEIQATEVEGEGALENKEEGEVSWGITNETLKFKNVTVTAPAGKGCKVSGGSITTQKLKSTTKGLTNQVKIEPFEGTKLFEFTVEGCSVTALNHAYSATGSVIGTNEGTTLIFGHAATTTQSTLFLFEQKAGIEGSLTRKDKTNGEGVAIT